MRNLDHLSRSFQACICEAKGNIGFSKFHFRRPECVSAVEAEERFGCGCNCPEQLPQPRFSSPTSSLPPERFARIRECIDEANELLLALGAERDQNNQRALQLSLRRLRKQRVSVKIDSNEQDEKFFGRLLDAGDDFIIMQVKDSILLIPFNRIIFLKHVYDTEGLESEQDLIQIDHCLRQKLVLDFGKNVTQSPYLLNVFYGISLRLFLESFVGSHIFIKSEGDEEGIKGILTKAGERSLEVQVGNEKKGAFYDLIYFVLLKKSDLRNII
ncbi:hypothetical protein [Bacillus sp. V5-8f]|uniref:hypothetical protein n=1 Tax=Bacillus sp. V5-8f TaxID=2053044 RepID=UPI000C7770DA|nr:hypothetical protein [Bacillus sp. V5-8f]PLT34066.1 hypothetical protein CUU64_10700 [Bacillus sp. V5-8f]